MEDVTRRDAVKLVAAGAAATGVLALAGGSAAEAQEAKKGAALGAGANMIPGIKLPASLGAALGGSPEDAAKTFLRAATQGMAQVMADALAQAVGSAVGGAVGGPPPDWVKLIKGVIVNLNWETPGNTPVSTVTVFAKPSTTGGGPSLGGVGFDVSVGIHGSF
jgi:hypothetical protein